MAIRNPQLTQPGVVLPVAEVGDATNMLRGVAQTASTVVENKTNRILQDFRGDIDKIRQDALPDSTKDITDPEVDRVDIPENPVWTLTAEDVTRVQAFADRMQTVNAIQMQGTGNTARIRALIEAEKSLREAQARYPHLATQLRAEAALVLGEDPTGTALAQMTAQQDAYIASQQEEWDDMVEYGRDVLRIPRTIQPGTEQWYLNYYELDKIYTENERTKTRLEWAENAATEADVALNEAREWIRNPKGVFNVMQSNLNGVLGAIQEVSPGKWRDWVAGADTLNVGGQEISYQEMTASLMSAQTNLNASLGLMTDEMRGLVSPAIEALNNSFNKTIDFISNPDSDISVLENILARDQLNFGLSISLESQWEKYKFDRMLPYFEFMAESVFPSMSVVERQEFFDVLLPIAKAGSIPGIIPNSPVDRMIQNAKLRNPPPPGTIDEDEYAMGQLQREFDAVRKTVLADPDAVVPQAIIEGFGTTMVGMIDRTDQYNNPAMTENMLQLMSQPETLEMLSRMSVGMEQATAEKIHDFYRFNVSRLDSIIRGITSDPRGITIQFNPETNGVDVTIPASRGRGGSYQTARSNQLKAAIDRRLRTLAILNQVRDGNEEPNYHVAYRNLVRDLPFFALDIEDQ